MRLGLFLDQRVVSKASSSICEYVSQHLELKETHHLAGAFKVT